MVRRQRCRPAMIGDVGNLCLGMEGDRQQWVLIPAEGCFHEHRTVEGSLDYHSTQVARYVSEEHYDEG